MTSSAPGGFGRSGLIVLSAVLHAAAFPPWNVTPLAFVALVPLLHGLRDLRPWHGVLAGGLWGTAAIWTVALWVPPGLHFYYEQPWWFVVIFCVVGSIVLWGSCYAVFGGVFCWLAPRSAFARVLVGAATWVACEYCRAWLITGEPWMLLGYTLVPWTSLIQAADFGGVYLLSAVVFGVNASLYEAWRARSLGMGVAAVRIVPGSVALLLLATYGFVRLAGDPVDDDGVPVAIIQGNNDVGMQWREEFYGRGLEDYLRMSAEAIGEGRPRLLVWPESAVTFFLQHEPLYQSAIRRLLSADGTELIVGGPHYEDRGGERERYYNSAFVMTPDGLAGRYDKMHLLPFAEYFPLQTIDFLQRAFGRVRTFTHGEEQPLLSTPVGKAAVVICFEAIFPELVRRQMARGGEVLINLSNDVWLGDGAGPEQHLSMVVLRAVENRTWVLRATTTGISALIDPNGVVRARSGMSTKEILSGRAAPVAEITFYRRFGDVFAIACLLAVLILGTFVAIRGDVRALGRRGNPGSCPSPSGPRRSRSEPGSEP